MSNSNHQNESMNMDAETDNIKRAEQSCVLFKDPKTHLHDIWSRVWHDVVSELAKIGADFFMMMTQCMTTSEIS